ncbi:hypothetical protein EMN47_00920 [Prolixibacteraceae bacterium JC049]|nr:hypothetical protein [Prolixibacteraceae bacterium JC049]
MKHLLITLAILLGFNLANAQEKSNKKYFSITPFYGTIRVTDYNHEPLMGVDLTWQRNKWSNWQIGATYFEGSKYLNYNNLKIKDGAIKSYRLELNYLINPIKTKYFDFLFGFGGIVNYFDEMTIDRIHYHQNQLTINGSKYEEFGFGANLKSHLIFYLNEYVGINVRLAGGYIWRNNIDDDAFYSICPGLTIRF